MAHMIENNEMAYVGAKPWHGLGHEVPAGTDGINMLKIAKIDYTVELTEVSTNGLVIPGYKAVTRNDNGRVFSIQSDRYKVVQNQEIVNLFQEYCDAGHAQMETVGAIRGGAIVWALAKLNGPTKMTLAGNDQVGGYILFSTSHDGTMPTRGIPTQVRVVCNNTFQAAFNASGKKVGFTLKHSCKWTPEQSKKAKEVLGISIEQLQKFNELSAQLSKVNIDTKGQVEFVSRLNNGAYILPSTPDANPTVPNLDSDNWFDQILGNGAAESIKPVITDESKLNRVGKSILGAIIDSPGSTLESSQNTLWGAINGVSYYTDHVASRTQDSRLYNAWFGTNVDLKESAVNVALEMAGL